MARTSSRLKLLAPLAALLVLAAACGGEKVGEDSGSDAVAGGNCGTVNLAINPWVGYEANAAVVAYVAETELGCKVVKKNLLEQVSWQGFSTGVVDVIIENWGHADLVKKYITDEQVAVDAGPTGNKGEIGWYVPPWLAKEHPDVLDWKNLNKYAAQFKTSESGDKGQLLDGDPSYVTNDAALVQNLKLNFKVVYSGSETALITALRQAEQQKKWLLTYFYSPQWFLNEVPAVKVKLPPYTEGCDADPKKVACDYPSYDLNKIVSKKFADSKSPAWTLVKNFTWTNEDQNEVAKSIAVDKLSAEDAAKKWVEANKDKVDAWLKQ
ncbi:ABC transporter substrate-binding protein [Cryptosporangium aurantiacum]|uniref:Glycine betaine/proline transport system substrate-binding protein n=1 Tax=Cryptosporangium aurantiacum TaxID=134849 RepID=A0A1M7MAE3_9ACTN|nr:ABC transporter substrate-binding protein [Cryptosporangium aurantiacum]SHM87255.1 glycine betaine/proline transport system substrate-binding protein [Cryptosporangium aurantiacum]